VSVLLRRNTGNGFYLNINEACFPKHARGFSSHEQIDFIEQCADPTLGVKAVARCYVWLAPSKLITTFPRACPSSRYPIASGTSLNL